MVSVFRSERPRESAALSTLGSGELSTRVVVGLDHSAGMIGSAESF
jgi:hypothetical protein